MPSRPQARHRRPVPCPVVLCAGLLAGALLPGTAHAAGTESHPQIIGGSRDHRGLTVSPTRAVAAAPGGRHAG